MICIEPREVILLIGTGKRTTEPKIVDRDTGRAAVVSEHRAPGHEIRLFCPPRTEPELDGKESAASGLPDEVRDRIDLVNIVSVGVEVLGEVKFLSRYRLALDGKVVAGVERIDKYIDVLGIELALFEPVGKSLHLSVGEKPVDAGSDRPFEIIHPLEV